MMGSCIGRCFCEVGKCFCCDCVIFGTNLRDTITRRQSRTKKSQTFTLRRQSSSTTIEFENLMFEFDIPNPSAIQMQPTSVSSWLALKDEMKQKELNVQKVKSHFTNPLSKTFNTFNTEMTSIYTSEDRSCELPIIDSLISRTALMRNKTDSPDMRDKTSLGGSSSLGELQWENEIINEEFNTIEQNGNELEWDHYEEDTMALHNETEQLILEIEEMTKTSINQLR